MRSDKREALIAALSNAFLRRRAGSPRQRNRVLLRAWWQYLGSDLRYEEVFSSIFLHSGNGTGTALDVIPCTVLTPMV